MLWSEFPAGPQLLHALACNEIDFGTTGEAPPVFAQASNSELMYVAWGAAGAAQRGDGRPAGERHSPAQRSSARQTHRPQ
ncbi:hypothetical protein LNP17_24895 [Klebsiella variicola subsp. variicola]|nr:hypothetical protein [Klebsiella variicola subsp. variicola]